MRSNVWLPWAGSLSVTAGAVASTRKVTSVLLPTLPASLDCSARAVYVPSASGVAGWTDQPAPERVVSSTRTGSPVGDAPAHSLTWIVSESPLTVPPAPEKTGRG